jgi:hypothetical protein
VQSCDGCRRLLAQVNRPSALFSLSVSKISPAGSRTPQEVSSDPTISSVNTRTIAGRSIASCLGHLLVSCDWRRYLGNLPGLSQWPQRLGPLGRFHLAFAMLQLDNARPCGGSRGLERFAPAEREGAVASGTLTLTIPFWKLCSDATHSRRASPPGEPSPSTPLFPKGKPRWGKRGFQQRTAFGGIGGILEAVLQTLVARASGGVQSGSGRGRAGRDGHGPVRSSALGSQSKVFASFD